jgi:predicted enzyme related to lactoylglutathione lyase
MSFCSAPACDTPTQCSWRMHDMTEMAITTLNKPTILTPMDFPGGRLAIVSDPQGAAFGLLHMTGG